jgi:hypothetical protein
MPGRLRLFVLFVLLSAISLTSCARKHQQEKTKDEGLQLQSAHGGMAKPEASGLAFAEPDGWIKETPSSSSRKYQYTLPRVQQDQEDATLVVSYFPGGGGTPQANVDRWIGQFQGKDGKPGTQSNVTHKVSHGIPVTIVDASGTYSSSMGPMQASGPKPNYRMLGAIAETKDGPWFVKLTGPEKTVAKWAPSFYAFLESMRQTGN